MYLNYLSDIRYINTLKTEKCKYFMLVYLFDGVKRHCQQYLIYIVAVSFIGGGNRRTRRKPPTCRKSQTLSHNVVHLALIRFELTTSVVIGTHCIGSCKSNYHTSTATNAPKYFR